MADIKVKQSKKGTIKTLDANVIKVQKIKENLVSAKEKTKETYEKDYNSGTDYATNKITKAITNAPNNVYRANKIGQNNYRKTQENLHKAQENIRKIKNKSKIKQRAKNISKIRRNATKTAKTTIKTADRTVKTVKETTKATAKASKRAIQTAKQTAKATVHTIKVTVKATITAIKAIIAGTKALISAIIAGGWVAVIIIIVICLIALLCSSFLGIFFSSEETSSNGKNMSSVISEINNEFISKITNIQTNTAHDEYDINSNRAEWKDILAIYAVKVSNGQDETDVITLSEEKIQILKTVFWDMNNITSNTEKVTKQITTTDDKGNNKTEDKEQTILHITITSKSVEEMIQMYNFNENQKRQIAELLNEKYAKMWSGVIYGSSVGNSDIVEVARQQIGNIGGQPYWSWYGFSSRVEWCACFVSWCANECGYIQAGIIPKFAGCQAEGVSWFKTCGLWKDRGYTPKTGDIIFFDWADSNDGQADHVGIIERVENNKVYTIEGNTRGDMCKQNEYDINSSVILGYGTPVYQ